MKSRSKTFYDWYASIDNDDKQALTEAALDGLPSSAIVKVIRANGGVGSKETIDVWRLNLEHTR